MPTRLYLRNVPSQQSGRPVGSATTDADQGHAGLARLVCLTMSGQKGGAGASAVASCVAHPAGGMDLFRIFLSSPLAAQTLASGQSFTFAGGLDQCVGGQGGGDFEHAYFRIYAYLWRPGVGKVCALFGDATGATGFNDPDPAYVSPFGPTWQVVALPALTVDVEARLRDRIVV